MGPGALMGSPGGSNVLAEDFRQSWYAFQGSGLPL